MKKIAVLACALASLLLASCAPLRAFPPPDKPEVDVRDGRIIVSPEPLTFRISQGATPIIWSLPAGSNLTFPANGIVFEGAVAEPLPVDSRDRKRLESIVIDRSQQDQVVDCKLIADGKKFQCLNRNSKEVTLKYTIRVLQGGQPLRPLDPTLMNY